MLWMWPFFVIGCGPRKPTEVAAADLTPILPAPDASLYTTGSSTPRDPLVARLIAQSGITWQESLSGAATYLTLHEPFAPELALARASVVLAKMQNTEVTDIVSTALESLLQGEIENTGTPACALSI